MGESSPKLNIYLASGFNWRNNFRCLAKNIEAKGHTISSSWIWIDKRPERNSEEWDNFATKIASSNLIDLYRSDTLVIDTRGIRLDGNGGAWSELGFALAKDWPIFLIGDKRNTFLWAEGIVQVDDGHQLMSLL